MLRAGSGCGGCGRAVRGRRRRACSQCSQLFHVKCANSQNSPAFISMDQSNWLCMECRGNNSQPTPLDSNPDSAVNHETDNFLIADELNDRFFDNTPHNTRDFDEEGDPFFLPK